MTKYLIRDDQGVEWPFKAATLDEAIDYMFAWMEDGEAAFDTHAGPVFYDAHLYEVNEDEDGDEIREEVHFETLRFDPPEPACVEVGGHAWDSPHEVLGGLEENPGVWGHGGGVIINEVCRHCGAYKKTDTWYQRQDTGEQGFEAVTYEPADDESLRWVECLKERGEE